MNSKTDFFLKPRVQVSYLKIKDVLHPLYEGLNFVGRRKDATVIIENQNVSQYHAVITITDNAHFVSDIGSFNGSFLDKNKLQPLILYELTEGSVIHFACITAIYVKQTPSNSQSVFAHQKNTQNLNESVFIAQTQQLEVENVGEVFNNCFDDDYDFNDVPTTQNVTTIVSVHDMPTQIFSSNDLEAIESCTSSKTGLSNIHDISTQINNHQSKTLTVHEMPTQIFSSNDLEAIESCTSSKTELSNAHDISTQINNQSKSLTVNEMPTQIILDESNIQTENSSTINELPTQMIALDKVFNLITCNKNKVMELHELPTQIINSTDEISTQKTQQDKQIEICSVVNQNEKDSIIKNPEQSSLINSDNNEDILCRPSTSKCFDNNADAIIAIDDDCVIVSSEPDCSAVNISDDIIEDSILENVTTENGDKQEYLLLKSMSKLTNSEPIPSQSSSPNYSQPVGLSTNKKKCRPIDYDTPSGSEKGHSSNSEDAIVAGRTKNCLRINSDSDTDMEDLLPASNSNIKNDKLDESGSATDIENNLNLNEAGTTKKVVRKRKKCRKIDSDSETDIEISHIENFDSGSDTDVEDISKTTTLSPNKISQNKKTVQGFNILNSDSDTDIENNEIQVVGKINMVREEEDSEIIPCTQLSDDDVDDFNFGLEKNDTIVEKDDLDDISENFSLRLSSLTELSEDVNNVKKTCVSGRTSEIHSNICFESSNSNKADQLIIEETEAVATTKATSEAALISTTTDTLISDEMFAQPTLKTITDVKEANENESLFVQSTQPVNIDDILVPPVQKSSSSKHLFDQPTQQLALENMESDSDLFMQPTQKLIETSKGEIEHLFSCPTKPSRKTCSSSKTAFDQPSISDEKCDDLFMQPTQKIVVPTSKGETDIENVFDQPTQVLVDDLFMQPTQNLSLTSKGRTEHLFSSPAKPTTKTRSNLDDVFDQPTQPLTSNEKCDNLFMQSTQELMPSTKRNIENEIFDCPTQPMSLDDKVDDLFMQPTQKITENSATQNEKNLFDCPTQPISISSDCDDLFMQPTQRVTQNLVDHANRPITFDENNEDDVFLQPTQKVILIADKQKDEENLFDQPTQTLTFEEQHSGNGTRKVFSTSDKKMKNILGQGARKVTVEENLNRDNVKDCDDLFLQPTQKVASTVNQQKENKTLFDLSTPQVTVAENLDDDLFLQPTQQITLPGEVASKSKSPLKVLPDNLEKGASVESQLEVMFASQPLPPQSNSRPSNPLLSILEGNYKVDSQDTVSGNTPVSEPLELLETEDEVTTKKQTRNREKVVVKENVNVDDKNNLPTKEENKSNKQLRSTRRPCLEDVKVDNAKISTRRSKRIDGVKSSERIEEQEVKTNKQTKNEIECSSGSLKNTDVRSCKRIDGVKSSERIEEQEVKTNKQTKNEIGGSSGSLKNTTRSKQSNKGEKEISKKSIVNDKLKIQEKKQSKTKDCNSSEETKMVVETKMNTRKRSIRSDSVELNMAKSIKKSKTSDKSETSDETNLVKSSSRLRKLVNKDLNKLNEVEKDVNSVVKKSSRTINTESKAGTSTEVIKSVVEKPFTISKSEVSTVARITRYSKKDSNSEQSLPKMNDTITIFSSDSSDDDIILNKPRISKRKQENQTTSSKHIKTSDMSPKSAPIAKRSRRLLSKTDSVNESVQQTKINESDTSDADSSNQSLQTPIKNRKLLNMSSCSDTPGRNKRKQKPKIVFTMLDSPELESSIRSLGGTIVDTVNACTVLVTGSLKRSQKLLSAVGQAKPICSVKWLQECKKNSTFLDPWDFILEDKEAETKWNFSLKESLIRSQNHKLLENYFILILTTTAVDVLKAAIESCGGKCVTRAPTNTKNFVVVASPENKTKYAKFIKQKITIVTPEAIFDGVLRQELNFKNHLLS